MPRNSLSLAVCLVTGLALLTGCKSVPLADPPPSRAGATPQQSRTAIIRALGDLRYVVDEESPGRIRARLQRNAWTMIVEITYGQSIAVRYADSVGLDYELEGDAPYIHQNYNARAAALQKEIQRQLTIVALEDKGVPSVGGGQATAPQASPPAENPPPPPAH
jgi:hypothetical protein